MQRRVSVNSVNPAYFGEGTKLTVLEQGREPEPPTVQILPPSPNECRNKKDVKQRKKTLVCVASGFYPDHVSLAWEVDGKNVLDGVATDADAKWKDNYYSISSRLRVAYDTWHDPGRNFTCIAGFYDGTSTTNIPLTINGVKNNSTDSGSMTREDYLERTNAVHLSYSVFIVKSIVYGVFVVFVVRKLQGSGGKGS